jgi:hypothetical protein
MVERSMRLIPSSLGSVASVPSEGGTFARVVVPPDATLPVRTAASELAAHTSAQVVTSGTAEIPARSIVLATGEATWRIAFLAERFPDRPVTPDWTLVAANGSGLVIAGATPAATCRAALRWIEDPVGESNRISTYSPTERFTMWDNTMNQMYRGSRGFDRRNHFREIARLGFTGVEINRYAGHGYHVAHRRFAHDSYAWYMSYAPALDAFFESSLTAGLYEPEELAANLADLREAAQLAREFGLLPGFVCYEPRAVNEAIFERYPELRGSRVDHPGRSLQPRYALDIAHPRVLAHYAELVTRLLEEVPELRYFNFWTQDSGSGLPFARRLYAGPNGSHLARTKTLAEIAHDFVATLVNAGRHRNPAFEVVMEAGWEYTVAEHEAIAAVLPRGATLSYPVGGSLLDAPCEGYLATFFAADRAAGLEPYVNLVAFSGHDLEPVIGVPAPRLLYDRWRKLKAAGARRVMIMEGIASPPQSAFNVNQELFAELLRSDVPDLTAFLQALAARWTHGSASSVDALVAAWSLGSDALAAWPKINWYHGGVGRTQGRWLTRPLVPDITRLDARERSAWERCLFPLPWDIARANVSFEGGVRFFEDADFERVIAASDATILPLLAKAIALLDRELAATGHRVVEDQRDRYRGARLCLRSDRNLFELQLATNRYLLGQGDTDGARAIVRAAIVAEIENTRDWIESLQTSRTPFFRCAEVDETPFLFATPLEDFTLKLDVMQRHLDDEPGPFLPDLREPRRRKLAFDGAS